MGRLSDRYLQQRLPRATPLHPAARAAEALITSHGRMTVVAAIRSTGLSERHFERTFVEQMGMAPKRYGRGAAGGLHARRVPRRWRVFTIITAATRLTLCMVRIHRATIAGLVLLLVCSARTAGAQEVDFTGQWVPIFHEDGPERLPGAELADYAGLPINDAARLRGDTYDPDRISAVYEYQCRQHAGDYGMRGLANMRITAELDPLTQRFAVLRTRIGFHDAERTIYLDGRPEPPANAPHTWAGHSVASWDGSMLNIRTTHLKAYYIRRNGVPASDQRTFTEHWMRHGNILTVVTVIDDPVFLTERLIRSQSWALDPGQTIGSNWCDTAPELVLEPGKVPNYLPGANPYLREFADWYGLPYEATRGGAETMYPEYRAKMPRTYSTLDRCTRYCQCMNVGGGCALGVQPAPIATPVPAAPARRPQ